MRDYGKVYSTFWTSETIRTLSDDGRMLALYLLTSPHATIAGVFRLPDGYVCEDLQWSAERVAEGFAELLANGFANRCETSKWVWVCAHLEWNPPENPNQRKAAVKCVASVPDQCCWKLDFMRVWGESLGLDTPKNGNPSETVAEPFANQKQEQEQEQKQERAASPDGSGERSSSASGSRLPPDWSLPTDWRTWAVTTRPDIDIDREADSFADYWRAKAGKDARKADWQATWRNWVRRANATPGHRNAPREPTQLGVLS